jgi:hypothetical protein
VLIRIRISVGSDGRLFVMMLSGWQDGCYGCVVVGRWWVLLRDSTVGLLVLVVMLRERKIVRLQWQWHAWLNAKRKNNNKK